VVSAYRNASGRTVPVFWRLWLLVRNHKRPAEKPADLVVVSSLVALFGRSATAVDGTGDVIVGGVEGFQGRAAGVVDPLEAEPAAFPLLCLVYDAAATLDAGVAKLLHCCVLLLPFF
jgi:hypothetical protein